MKIIPALSVLLFSLYLLLPLGVHADEFSEDEEEINSAVAVESWLSQADAKWQISFSYVTTAGQPGTVESQLDFKKINSPVIIYTAGGKVAGNVSFDLLYGTGAIHGGHGQDTDRFIPDTGGGYDFSQSTNDISGNVQEWGINFYYNHKGYGSTAAGPWGMVLGYLHYTDSLRLTNAVQTVSVPFDNLTFPPPGPFPGLNSTYDFTWNLLRAGVLYQPRLTESLSLTGTFSVYPYVNYAGDGFWNLRTSGQGAFRSQSPNFIQTSTMGYGYEASLGLTYDLTETVALSTGYRYFYLYAGNGTYTTYFADGTLGRSKLDWVTVVRQGAYGGLLFKF